MISSTQKTGKEITPQGQFILVLAFIGIILGMNFNLPFLWFPSFVIIFYFISLFQLYIRPWNVSVVRMFASSTVTLGGFLHCRVQIVNLLNSPTIVTIEQNFTDKIVLVKGWTLQTIKLNPKEKKMISFIFTFTQRGIHEFHPMHVYRSDPFGLYKETLFAENLYEIRVIPARPFVLLDKKQKKDVRDTIAGAHAYRRRGQGDEFFSLREYVRGDEPRKIYWKGTSKRGKLISKEYTDEVVFRILVAVDTSWTMRAKKLEYALTTLLELAEMNAQNNDSFGFLIFDEAPRIFLKPLKSPRLYEKTARMSYDIFASKKKARFEVILPYILSLKGTKGILVIFSDTEGILEEKLKSIIKLSKFGHKIIYCDLRGDYLGVVHPASIETLTSIEKINYLETVRKRAINKYQIRENRFRENLDRIGATYIKITSLRQNLLLLLKEEFGEENQSILQWMFNR